MTDQLCTCEAIDNEICQCSLLDGDCIQITGKGTPELPFVGEPVFDPDVDNLASEAVDGLLVQLPTYITNPPRCEAYHNANVSTTSDVGLLVALNSERFDSDPTGLAMHDTATLNSRITIRTAGIYVVTFVCAFAGNATGDRLAVIRKNGTDIIGSVEKGAASAAFETGLSITIQEQFEVDEYVEASVRQDSGGALNLIGSTSSTVRYSPVLSVIFRRRVPAV